MSLFFTKKKLDSFCDYSSSFGGHPDSNKINGIECSTGSLGHGFPYAAGIAYVNKLKKIYEYLDIDNIPIKKWVHCVIVLNGMYLDVYINGLLKTRKKINGMPKQNFGDLWLSLYGGFDGYMSNMRYFRKALKYYEIEDITKKGPSNTECLDSGNLPPYLDDNWWYDF